MGDVRQIDGDLGRRVAARLTDLQGERSDKEMAALLGCTREHYWNVKNERRSVSYALLKRAARQFPGISEMVLMDLAGVTS